MFEPPDTFHLSAAIGWLELGNPAEASEELDKITPSLLATPEVLSVRSSIYFSFKNWQEADSVTRILVELQPEVPSHSTNLAYAARRKPDGSLLEAKEILLKAADLFPREFIICYNLCCYESQLGNLEQAKIWLHRAYELGDRKTIQEMAREDADLEPLRKIYNLLG